MAAPASTMTPALQEGTPGPIYVDTQHEDLVHDAQLDYYGCKLATSSSGTSSYFVSRRNRTIISSALLLFFPSSN